MHSPGVIPVKWNFLIGFKSSPLHMVCQTSPILKSLSFEITPVTKLSIKNVQERIIMLIAYSSVSIVMFTIVKVIRFMHYTHYPKFLLSFYPPNHLQKNIASQGDKEQEKNPKTNKRIPLNKYLFYLYYISFFLQSTAVFIKLLQTAIQAEYTCFRSSGPIKSSNAVLHMKLLEH